jgi:anti-sigma factor RsiW
MGMAAGPEQRLNPEERANLAAYIDGELTENESRAIATKLSLSGIVRREVESLKQTWELLEYLPRPKASLVFSERTLTSIRSLESRAGSWDKTAGAWIAQAARLAVCLAVAAASLALGFALTRWALPDPSARMVRDLSLAEHLEEYKEVGSFEFLEELAKSKEFGGPSPSH